MRLVHGKLRLNSALWLRSPESSCYITKQVWALVWMQGSVTTVLTSRPTDAHTHVLVRVPITLCSVAHSASGTVLSDRSTEHWCCSSIAQPCRGYVARKKQDTKSCTLLFPLYKVPEQKVWWMSAEVCSGGLLGGVGGIFRNADRAPWLDVL